MSLESAYAAWMAKLNSAVADAMQGEVYAESKDVVAQNMESVVYSYDATPQAMSQRRGTGGGLSDPSNLKPTFKSSGFEHELTIENTADFQGTQWSPDLITVVERGLPNFKQPGARPVMQESQDELESGRALSALASALHAKGF